MMFLIAMAAGRSGCAWSLDDEAPASAHPESAAGAGGKIDYKTLYRERTCTDPSSGLISETYQAHASAPVASWR